MRKWISLVVLLAILTGIDLGAKSIAEEQVEVRARDSAPRGSEVSASIQSVPFLARLLLLGSINRTEIELRNVPAPGIVFARVGLDLRGVEFDRGRLISAQEAEIISIDRGTVIIEITQEAFSEKLGVPIRIAGGAFVASLGGRDIRAQASVDDGVLALEVAPFPVLRAAVPTTNYAPCVGDLTILAGRARFTCTIREVPPAFVGAANRAVAG